MMRIKIKAGSALAYVFPEIYRVAKEQLLEENPYWRHSYFSGLLERKVKALTYSLIEFQIVDFREEWKR